MKETNTTFSRIEILEIEKIDVSTETLPDQTAIYPCTVKWRPVDSEASPNLAVASQKATESVIKILSILKSAIKPGLYVLKGSGNYERAVA